jgi:hypothetical protein
MPGLAGVVVTIIAVLAFCATFLVNRLLGKTRPGQVAAGILDVGLAALALVFVRRYAAWYRTAYSIRGVPDYWPVYPIAVLTAALGLRMLWAAMRGTKPFE